LKKAIDDSVQVLGEFHASWWYYSIGKC